MRQARRAMVLITRRSRQRTISGRAAARCHPPAPDRPAPPPPRSGAGTPRAPSRPAAGGAQPAALEPLDHGGRTPGQRMVVGGEPDVGLCAKLVQRLEVPSRPTPWRPRCPGGCQQSGDTLARIRPLQGEELQGPALVPGDGRQHGLPECAARVGTGRQTEGSAEVADTVLIDANADGAGQGGVDHPGRLPHPAVSPRPPDRRGR